MSNCFVSFFGRNEETINCFWHLHIFRKKYFSKIIFSHSDLLQITKGWKIISWHRKKKTSKWNMNVETEEFWISNYWLSTKSCHYKYIIYCDNKLRRKNLHILMSFERKVFWSLAVVASADLSFLAYWWCDACFKSLPPSTLQLSLAQSSWGQTIYGVTFRLFQCTWRFLFKTYLQCYF